MCVVMRDHEGRYVAATSSVIPWMLEVDHVEALATREGTLQGQG